MHDTINQPYSPDRFFQSGTYRVNVGPVFYLGSTTKFGSRNSDHRVRLERGEHPNKRLQAAYDEHQSFEFIILTLIPRKDHDADKDHIERLKFNEQNLLDAHKGDPNLANASESSRHNSTIGDYMKAKWQNPEFRESQIRKMKARKGDAISPETRAKMAEAKRGKNNAKAIPCVIHFQGQIHKFDCVSDAAKHFKATQQAMDMWLKGIMPWPGTGPRKPKRPDLVGMTGWLARPL